ncbi:MAG: hypothetical protein BA871_14495 [Desulfuromonadales bacterium C00003096]|jgi:hypothetical protein|nr:MAG: hypothetical protein BA871_14495 [Desulfuromonadales bacterium C00003096]
MRKMVSVLLTGLMIAVLAGCATTGGKMDNHGMMMDSQKVGRAGKSSIIRPAKPFGEARSLNLRKI